MDDHTEKNRPAEDQSGLGLTPEQAAEFERLLKNLAKAIYGEDDDGEIVLFAFTPEKEQEDVQN